MTRDTVPSDGWMRNKYGTMEMATPGIPIDEEVPLALIRARAPGMPTPHSNDMIRAFGVLDTGASRTLVPMWALRRLGITVDGASKVRVLSATGWIEVYKVRIGLEVFYGDEWIDLGMIDAVSPDTEVSRSHERGLPFLLGRRGFFDKFQLFLDEPKKETWLRRLAA